MSVPAIPREPFKYFWYITRPFKARATLVVSVVVLAASADQATSYFFKLIVDAVERTDYAAVLRWGLLFPVAVFGVQLLYRITGYLTASFSKSVEQKGYDDLCRYVFSHSHAYFSDRLAGSVLSKITNVTNSVDDIIPDFLWTQLNGLMAFLVTFAFMLYVDITTALLFLVLAAALFVINHRMSGRKSELSRASAEAQSALRGRIVDVLGNISIVRQFTRKHLEYVGIHTLTEDLKQKATVNWRYTEWMLLLNGVILFVFGLGMFWSLTQQLTAGNISAGDFVLILSLVSQLTGTLLFIGRSFNTTARAIGEVREGLQDLIIEQEITDTDNAKPLQVLEATIHWQDVTFEYAEHRVFQSFNLTIPAGQRVGLVGPSGAGKTTFVSLLLRQHDLGAGAILIDGQDIAAVTQDSLRENIAIVPQEPILFHRSIKENIAYGKPEATENEIMAVARLAKAHDFIKDLPQGYDTLVGERGVKLSGGQKQRVAIARAMLKNAPILALDEATSALDSESEVAIQQALHKLMAGKTVIAIAHRLSTLREMDRIIVLENGRIVEDGSHDALLAYGGVYARLWAHQAGGFLQE